MVKNLLGLGFNISVDDCLSASDGEIVARPHIVKALKSKDSNIKVLEKLRLKMKKAAEYDEKIKDKYEKMKWS